MIMFVDIRAVTTAGTRFEFFIKNIAIPGTQIISPGPFENPLRILVPTDGINVVNDGPIVREISMCSLLPKF